MIFRIVLLIKYLHECAGTTVFLIKWKVGEYLVEAIFAPANMARI